MTALKNKGLQTRQCSDKYISNICSTTALHMGPLHIFHNNLDFCILCQEKYLTLSELKVHKNKRLQARQSSDEYISNISSATVLHQGSFFQNQTFT